MANAESESAEEGHSHSRSSSSCSYLALLNSFAQDLDLMLNELCADELHFDDPSHSRLWGENFLEPYLHGIGGDVHNHLDTSPLLSDNRRKQHSPNQNSTFHQHQLPVITHQSNRNGYREAINPGYGESPVPNAKETTMDGSPESQRLSCLEDIEALSLQNKQQLNEILKLAGRRDIVSTGRSGRIIQRSHGGVDNEQTPLIKHADLNDNTSEETLSQRDDALSESDDAGSEDSDGTESDVACGIALMERLIRSHPVWFLPGLQRTGAVHLLQGKEEGNFVVRQSSQPDTMAISVRLPAGKGPYIEHYLILAHGSNLSLESSENMFDSIPKLICHYAKCCDELPVQLTLPKTINDAKNRQQLSSLALLGQEFWRYPMAHPKNDQSANTSPTGSLSSFGSVNNNNNNKGESCRNEIILDLSPLPLQTMSTFKSPELNKKPARPNTLQIPTSSLQSTTPSPFPSASPASSTRSPPLGAKTPPQPPPRWAKPSPSPPNNQMSVTTTVTFSVQEMQLQSVKVTPNHEVASTPAEADTSRLSSPASEQSLPFPSANSPSELVTFSQKASRLNTLVSPISDTTNLVSRGFQNIENMRSLVSTPTEKNRSRRKKRESQHYKEFDILKETPNFKSVCDKPSDYEDVWVGESFKTFKPDLKKPDLIEKLSPLPRDGKNFGSAPAMDWEEEKKHTSPFYAEPADSLKPDTRPAVTSVGSNRHSDPAHFAPWLATYEYPAGGTRLQKIDSRTELIDSRSADNILIRTNGSSSQRRSGVPKVVQPPRVTSKTEPSWTVDSSWEFIGQDDNVHGESQGRFPSIEQVMDSEHRAAGAYTVRHIIAKRFPHLRLDPTVDMRKKSNQSLLIPTGTLLSRVSAYDNLEGTRRDAADDSEDGGGTVASEPWDNKQPMRTRYDYMVECDSESTIRVGGDAVLDTEDEETIFETPKKPRCLSRKSFKDRLDPLLSPPRIQSLGGRGTTGGLSIRSYALHLASDKTTTFAQSIDNFIACTLEAKESSPQVVMRNMRQFMSGMKNYLVKHGEKEFEKHVELERMKLKSTEFLNLDTILESVMHKLVVRPLKSHLNKLFVEEYTKSGAIQVLHENMLYARTKPLSELGIRTTLIPPSEEALQNICQCITALQDVDSPLDKLQYLLTCIATIFNTVKSTTERKSSITLGADDFLPLFVWVLVQSGFVEAEIEAEYMWGLLHPSLLSGEGGYYLTTLSSAVHVLKNFKACQTQITSSNWNGRESLLKIVVPDELHGSILKTTLPIRPHMTTKDVTKILAHKVRITNPQDYGLFKLVDGEETLLGDHESPQDVKNSVLQCGKHCMLAYKRIDAKIAWPNT